MPHQLALNVIAEITPGRLEALKTRLGTICRHVNDFSIFPFNRLQGVHFARLIVFDAAHDLEGNLLAPKLAMLISYDAPMGSLLRNLADDLGTALDDVFGHCVGYPDATRITPARRESFLRAHTVASRADYVNTQGRSVRQILDEDALFRRIGVFLDDGDFTSCTAVEVHREVVEFVRRDSTLRFALRPPEPPSWHWRARESLHRIAVGTLVIVTLPIVLIVLPLFLLLLRRHENHDRVDTSTPDPVSVRRFRADEDHWVQNQIVAVGLVKPGRFRALTTRLILAMTQYACRHVYNDGVLSGLNTIHFARWVSLDNGRRLFFSSNYDGSLESYMNDFIDKAAWGLNAIFSNGDGFPATRFLFCGGITDEKAYKRFLPTRQVHSRLWYSAYPHLTTKNIANQAAIRIGLSRQPDESEARQWLARFGSGNRLPPSGWIARQLDRIDWGRLCQSK